VALVERAEQARRYALELLRQTEKALGGTKDPLEQCALAEREQLRPPRKGGG
jgi:hypothetical protein